MNIHDTSPMGLRWLFVDMNSYFASVEQQENPHLRGRPVAVVPMLTDSTCAIAASYEAKAFGIRTGTPVHEAKALCPDLVCVVARHDVYTRYHEQAMVEIARHTPLSKIWSIDEVSSRLLPLRQSLPAALDVARAIKTGLRDHLGACIRASIGLAPNGYLAKIASDMNKPDGLTVLLGEDLPGRLFDLGLRDLVGIGPNMHKRLNAAGLWTVADLWNTAPKQLRAVWGGIDGERFWYRLHGYDLPDLEQGKSVIGHSRVLDPGLRNPSRAMEVARRLTVKACQRLRRYGLFAASFGLSVRNADGSGWSQDMRLHPAQDNLTFVRTLHQLWQAMMSDTRAHRFKKVAISLHGLSRSDQTTGDLFETAAPSRQMHDVRKHRALSTGMDALNKKFGPNTIHFGILPDTKAGAVGTKIAFSRIPDIEEFWE